jgi:predicted  nucleic acid-binding Zn-ribbon protein
MLDRRNAIEELRRRIRQSEAEAENLHQQLGEYLSYQPAESFSDTPLADTRHRIGGLREKLPETRQQVKRILQCVSRSEELEKSIRNARTKMADLQEEGERICEEIGRAAFEAYRSTRPVEPEYEKIFAPLIKQEEELSGLESEMEKAQSGTKSGNFFRIFRESGRTLYVKGLVSLKKKNMTRAYREAGHKFCDSDLVKEVSDPELKYTLAPYQENLEQRAAIDSEMESLQERQEKLWKELKELGAERSHHRRVREIEHQIEQIEEELEASFGSLGRMYRSKPLKSFVDDPEIKKILRQILRVEKGVEQDRKQITRIEAAIQIDALDKQVATMEERAERLAREIKTRQEEIRSLSERVKEAQEQKKRLETLRGPEETVLKIKSRGNADGEANEEST